MKVGRRSGLVARLFATAALTALQTSIGLARDELEQGRAVEAVASVQNALRGEPDSPRLWILLGEGYADRGSHLAAFRAFNRALELSPGAAYPLFRVGTIHQSLHEDAKAADVFRQVLKTAPR